MFGLLFMLLLLAVMVKLTRTAIRPGKASSPDRGAHPAMQPRHFLQSLIWANLPAIVFHAITWTVTWMGLVLIMFYDSTFRLKDFGVKLPALTLLVLDVSDFMLDFHWFLPVIILLGLAVDVGVLYLLARVSKSGALRTLWIILIGWLPMVCAGIVLCVLLYSGLTLFERVLTPG